MAATKLTEWPSLFPKPIKEAIALHFTLCESRSPKAGERLATEVYTPAGVLHGTRRIYAGSDGLKLFHAEACESTDSRQYEITRAYTFDSTGSDVVLLGQLRWW